MYYFLIFLIFNSHFLFLHPDKICFHLHISRSLPIYNALWARIAVSKRSTRSDVFLAWRQKQRRIPESQTSLII